MHHCAQTFARMNIWLQSSVYCSAVESNVSGWFKIVQYSTKGCNCIVQCRSVQWEWMQLQIVHRKASHCHKLVNWAKLGPDKILDSDLFAFIWTYFYADFRFVFLDLCWTWHFVRICICWNQFEVSQKDGVLRFNTSISLIWNIRVNF